MLFKLPFYNPQITINDIISSFFLRKPKENLEKELKDYFQVDNILLLRSARQGIEFVVKSINLKPEEEIIVPSFICSALSEAVSRGGGKPVFCDAEKNGFNMDIESVKKLISSKTRAIILAYIFGIPSSVDKFVELCKEKNLVFIEDCAQSFGAKYKGKLLGTFGDFAVFSFGISKNIGGLGGGLLLCQNKESFQKIKELGSRNKRDTISLKKYLEFFLSPLIFNRYFYYLVSSLVEEAAKIKRTKNLEKQSFLTISNLATKIALLKFKRHEKSQKVRNENALLYQKELKGLFSFPEILPESEPAYPYFPIFASSEIFNTLRAKNMPVRRLGFGGNIEEKYLLLPLNYSSREIKLISEEIKEVLNYGG